MLERCPDSQSKCKATLPDYELVFAGYSKRWKGGVATIRPCKGMEVKGAIYEISDKDLNRLDRYEGHPIVYNRIKVKVTTEYGESVEAVTYIMREPFEETQPSEEYLKTIQQGYKDWEIA